MNIFCARLLLISVVVFGFALGGFATEPIERRDCFNFEGLDAGQRERAESLLLKALDSEALYTFIGGSKPMSSGFISFSVDEKESRNTERKAERDAKLREIEETRRILARWKCGGLFQAEVQHFARVFDGKRMSEGVVFNRRALSEMIDSRSDFFSRWAITPTAEPLTVLFAVENATATSRFAGYGYLFGYPDHAIRFFVDAANQEELTGKFVERDFYSIGTFAGETNRFVFAVPKGHKERPEDRELKTKATAILDEYRKRRALYIGPGKKGVVELMRDWLCDADGRCESPAKSRSVGN